eukprot:TRINITY_DN5751_c0_g1_i1.p1 TRINITY_DN5751_c0_g1~~TRINITY_DN5751_c0_g1_i1.p1  ORF type:complete len:367 (+),score=74.55 TRINITY_DN5751_c0_g1_i1:106-1206(+)
MASEEPSAIPSLPQSLFQSNGSEVISGFAKAAKALPPCAEVFPFEAVLLKKNIPEHVNISKGLVLLKGRVDVVDVFGMKNIDLVPGKYEGGLKLWESSIDLISVLKQEINNKSESFEGTKVLELGCGHGLPGIFACLEGATTVHFQDFNAEVLRCLTIPNVKTNLNHFHNKHACCADSIMNSKAPILSTDIHYYAGDWSQLHTLLSVTNVDHLNSDGEDDQHTAKDTSFGISLVACEHTSCEEPSSHCNNLDEMDITRQQLQPDNSKQVKPHGFSLGGYDIILMAETVYSIDSLPTLYGLIKKCLRKDGVLYLAAKRHYFGVGGGTQQFKKLIDADGALEAQMLMDIADGASNVREIWKFFFKEAF